MGAKPQLIQKEPTKRSSKAHNKDRDAQIQNAIQFCDSQAVHEGFHTIAIKIKVYPNPQEQYRKQTHESRSQKVLLGATRNNRQKGEEGR